MEVQSDAIAAQANYEELSTAWHDGQRYNPATLHRRRLMFQILKKIDFQSVLEIGCGQPYLMQSIQALRPNIAYTGTDISKALIESNRKEYPSGRFEVLDIVNQNLPEQFDLIIATESLEHVPDYHKALQNLAGMARKYILITVPSSKVFPIDRMIGHFRHYKPEDMIKPLEELGFKTTIAYKWGFPFHNLYKHLINTISTPEKMQKTFAEGEFTPMKRFVSKVLYWLFFLNIKWGGYQLVLLAERK